MAASETDYTTISDPYNDLMMRQSVDGTMLGGGASTSAPTVDDRRKLVGEELGDLWIKNFIRSTNWAPKKTGFNIDGKNGSAEFAKGWIGGWDITQEQLSSGSGATTVGLNSAGDVALWAGDATPGDAPFQVSAGGDVTVNSLKRNDFEHQDMFVTLDGFSSHVSGTGANSLSGGLYADTGATVSSNAGIYLQSAASTNSPFLWTKKRRFKAFLNMPVSVDDVTCFIGTGDINTVTNNHFGFRITGGFAYATSADGTTEKNTIMSGVSSGQWWVLDALFDPGVSVIFNITVPGSPTISTTHTVNIPLSAGANYNDLINIKITNSAGASKVVQARYFNIWVEG